MENLILWMRKLYDEQIDFDLIEGSKEYTKFIKSSVYFPLNRYRAFINLKYNLAMKTSGYTYITFTIKTDESSSIYATAYYLENIPKFLCLSPTFISSKGEFRDGFIKFDQYEYVYKHHIKEITEIEEKILKKLQSGIISITYNLYPHTSDTNIDDIDMLSIRLLVCSIYLIIYKKQFNQIQVHSDKVYVNLIQEIDKFENYKIETNDIFNRLFKGGFDRPFGQKLIPLSIGEAIKINNISYPAWKELFITYAVSDMVLNIISPTFPIGTNWTYLEGSNSDMFDNKMIKDKYKQNEDVTEIIENLQSLYKYSEGIDDMIQQREKIFETLSDLSSNKLLSNLALALVDEFASFTIGTIPRTIKNSNAIPPKYLKFVSDIHFFNKYMFDLMYGCHVLHKKIGIIHFDLHLNNMTIMDVDESFYSLEDNKYKYIKDKKYHTAFIVDDQQETYIFPFEGSYGTLIDFSDSVISKDFLKFTDQFTRFTNFEDIIDKEKEDIFNRLSTVLTYVKKYKDKVKGAIISEYDNMFKAITAIDFVFITRNIRLMLEKEIPKDLLSTEVLDRAIEMEDITLEYLLTSVQNVVDKEGKPINYVGDILLSKFFKNYKYHKKKDNINLYEIYNFKARWNYSSIIYNKFPDWAKKDIIEKKYGKSVVDQLFRDGSLPKDIERDVHLAFLIERLNSEYGTNIIQTEGSNLEEI